MVLARIQMLSDVDGGGEGGPGISHTSTSSSSSIIDNIRAGSNPATTERQPNPAFVIRHQAVTSVSCSCIAQL